MSFPLPAVDTPTADAPADACMHTPMSGGQGLAQYDPLAPLQLGAGFSLQSPPLGQANVGPPAAHIPAAGVTHGSTGQEIQALMALLSNQQQQIGGALTQRSWSRKVLPLSCSLQH